MASVMDLADGHRAQITRFAQFFKGKRDRILADRESEKEEFKMDRLADDGAIFNKAEVEALLDAYYDSVMQHLSEDLTMTANISAVYCTQLLAQAEQVGMEMRVDDISVVEDQSRLGQISALAALQGAPPPLPKPRAALPTLGASSADPQALQQIQDLNDENAKMRDRYQQMQMDLNGLLRERTSLTDELEKVKFQFTQLMHQVQHSASPETANSETAMEIERTLNDTKAALDSRSAEVEMMKRDMESRLGDSTQFRQLQALLKKKSEQVKELRQTMVAYGIQPPDEQEGGVELEAED